MKLYHIYLYVNSFKPYRNKVLMYIVLPSGQSHWHSWVLSNINKSDTSIVRAAANDILHMIILMYEKLPHSQCAINLFCTCKLLKRLYNTLANRSHFIKTVHKDTQLEHSMKRITKGLQYFYTVTWSDLKLKEFKKLVSSVKQIQH